MSDIVPYQPVTLTPVDQLGLKRSHLQTLENDGFTFLEQFCFLDPPQLSQIPHLGKAGQAEIKQALAAKGKSVGMFASLKFASPEFQGVLAGGRAFLEETFSIAEEADIRTAFTSPIVDAASKAFQKACTGQGASPTQDQILAFERAINDVAKAHMPKP